MKYSILESRKNVKVKYIESYKPRERYQSDKVLLPNFVWDRFKYRIQRCLVPLNDRHFAKLGGRTRQRWFLF